MTKTSKNANMNNLHFLKTATPLTVRQKWHPACKQFLKPMFHRLTKVPNWKTQLEVTSESTLRVAVDDIQS